MNTDAQVFPGGPAWETLPAPVTRLQEHEVFVFGSNRGGVHGAGSAGQAMRGDARNTWRGDPLFLAAMAAPAGHSNRVGLWAVYGQASGPMLGRNGKSYAVVTVERPGLKRSTPLQDIQGQLMRLCHFALKRPAHSFLITPLGEGYAGYTRAEMSAVWQAVAGHLGTLPENLRFVNVQPGGRAH